MKLFFWKRKTAGGPQKRKSKAREWIEAAVFAIVVATLIRTFLFEAFMIPSGSMERTLLIHDYLFVSKISYGPRIPMTPLAFPFANHTLPFTKTTKSYSTAVQWPYKRLPGFSEVKRNDVIVFNYPCGDTALYSKSGDDADYYVMKRNMTPDTLKLFYMDPIYRPVDRRETWIKRAVGISGDTIMVVNGQLFVNGKPGFEPPEALTGYQVKTRSGKPFNDKQEKDLGVDGGYGLGEDSTKYYIYDLTKDKAALVQQWGDTILPDPKMKTRRGIFPGDPDNFPWSEDTYGPVYVPEKGATVALDTCVLPLYRRIIVNYENNQLEVQGDKIFINGKETKSYTFKMNYYWMMGDNRHQSIDSRFWGFVPEDHLIGKAWVIWFSFHKTYKDFYIRWGRFFTLIK
ncbi:signal peptidase I [Chitinophaga oryzae]|uniref:Signal peptidase I n=1 Tax=Chitinophaga oryzae TaxID=2725414 RepID=A0AAE6ZHF1_9BACT|nr:signal peptidase I [Chitinophaga oryzae]QJB33203.1 signal peptidase I [Chitinophaga oryzae]QJB39679.1 signal peptidase I [Chitinophaga oryzae]